MTRTARGVGRAEALRYDALQTKLAGVPEDDVTRLLNMVINLQPHARLGQQSDQQHLAPLDWLPPQVLAVKLDQVEGVKEDVSVRAAIAQPVKAWHSIIVASHRLPVDETRHRFDRERGAANQWKPAGPIMPVTSEKPHAGSIAAHQHAKPIVLDFMQPACPSRRLRGWARQAGLAEVGEGYSTQQHGRKLTAFFTRGDS